MNEGSNLKIVALCEQVIKWGLYILAFLVPVFFLPFTANILELNKQLLLLVFSLFFLIAWLGKIIASGQLKLKKSLLNLGIILFLIFYLISAAVSKNLYQSLVGGNGMVQEAFFSLFALVIIFFVLVNNLKNRSEVQNVIFALTLSAFLAGIYGMLQLAGKFVFPWDFVKNTNFNTVGSVNALEIFLGGMLVLSAVLFAESGTARWRQIFYGVAAGFFLLMVLSINFPNVWWGLLAATVVIIGLGIMSRKQLSQYRLILPMVILAFAVLMLMPIRFNIFGSWLKVPVEISPSLRATVDIGKQALKSNLFFGTGPGNYAYDYGLYRSTVLNQTDFWNVRFSAGFSKVTSFPATIGLFGSLLWVVLVIIFAIYGFIRLVKRSGRNWVLALAIFSAWFLLAVLQFLYTTNLTLEFAFWMIMGLAFLTLKSLTPRTEEETVEEADFTQLEATIAEFERTSPLASIFSFVLVIVLVATISVLYLGGSYYYADILYQRGLVDAQGNSLENGSVVISRAVMLNPYNDLYLRTLAQAALMRVDAEFGKPQSAERDSGIQNLVATAINIAKRSTDLAPLNVDNWVQRASIYRAVMPYTAGADQWAIDSYSEATRLEPQNPFYFLELGRSYVLAADLLSSVQDAEQKVKREGYLSKAEEALSTSVSLKPDYSPSIYQLALLYDYEGKLDQAVTRMKETRDINPQDVGVAFQLGLLYYKQLNWDAAGAEFERAVLLDNNYSNARYFLGLIYDRQGNKVAAIEQFEKIQALNLDNQDVKTILANLRAGKPALPQQPSGLPIQEKTPQEQPPQPGL